MKKWLCSEKLLHIAISLLIPLVTLFVLYSLVPPFFMESDDSEIQDVYRGCYTSTGYPYDQFVNVFMGYLQVALFKIV
ncbi:MAG: hypothetical protein II187_05700, partial [Treponema sp.]|nr:hypothetical protein [Treponema sp.]